MTAWAALLTGAQNGLADYPFPISTLTLNLKSAVPSYHSVSTPYSTETLEAFLARPAGLVRLYRDGVEFTYFNQSGTIYQVGGRSGTVQARGYRQQTYAPGPSQAIARSSVVEARVLADLSLSLSVDPALPILPAAPVTYGGASYVVRKVDIRAGAGSSALILNLEEVV